MDLHFYIYKHDVCIINLVSLYIGAFDYYPLTSERLIVRYSVLNFFKFCCRNRLTLYWCPSYTFHVLTIVITIN